LLSEVVVIGLDNVNDYDVRLKAAGEAETLQAFIHKIDLNRVMSPALSVSRLRRWFIWRRKRVCAIRW
jgi:acylphosphatase